MFTPSERHQLPSSVRLETVDGDVMLPLAKYEALVLTGFVNGKRYLIIPPVAAMCTNFGAIPAERKVLIARLNAVICLFENCLFSAEAKCEQTPSGIRRLFCSSRINRG